jgi:hypothetical protein
MSHASRFLKPLALACLVAHLSTPAFANVFDDIGAFLSSVVSDPAPSDPEAESKFCDKFALTVAGPPTDPLGAPYTPIQQSQRNDSLQATMERLGCDYHDSPRWNDDYWGRWRWCSQEVRVNGDAGKKTVLDEEQNQRGMVKICQKADVCNKYATDAVETAKEYKADFCYEDPAYPGRFSTKRNDHFEWCMNHTTPEGRDNEEAGRHLALAQCQRSKDNIDGDACRAYAEDAVKIATEFKDHNCVGDPEFAGRYSTNEQDHYDWCMNVASPAGLKAEKDGRYKDLGRCLPPHSLGKAKPSKTGSQDVAAEPESGDPSERPSDMRPQASSGISEIVKQEATEVDRGGVDAVNVKRAKAVIEDGAKAAISGKDMIEDGAKAAVVGAVAVKAGRKIVDYGAQHEVEIRRAADTAKYKLKERTSTILAHRPATKLETGGLRSKLSRVAGIAKVGILRRLMRR